jgi:type VI secretion system protein ImpC
MSFELNFGKINAAAAKPGATVTGRFRIALLGDFSARANRGRLETGSALAGRKAIKVDCDNLDKVIQRLQIELKLEIGGGAADLAISSMDDFHPEQLFENLGIFSELSGLRQRLKMPSAFAKAAAELQSWAGNIPTPAPAGQTARGSTVPTDGLLSDFAQLIGKPTVEAQDETGVQDLLKQIVGPYVVPAKDPRQDAMVAAVDEGLSAAMRSVLHHPDFQALEALWRSVDFLVRRLETGPKLELVLLDVSAEEMAADLSGADALENCGLYRLLVEQPALDAQQGAYSAIIANYTFARTRPHAELLGRLAKVASDAPAAFVAAIAPGIVEENPKEIPPEISDSWTALGALPEAGYLALLTPPFMLRQPYGKRSEPVDCFDFEEITPKTGLTGFLWTNPSALAGLLLGQTFTEHGLKMSPGSILSVGDLPFYYFRDKDGDQAAMPCTEKLMTSREASLVASQHFIPVVSMKGSPEVRLGGFQSLAGTTVAGPWAPIAITRSVSTAPLPPAAATPELAPEPAVPAEVEAPVPMAAAEAPAAAPETTDSTGDADLDALLAGLAPADEPAPSTDGAAPAEAPPGDLDPDLADLLKGL